MKLLFLLAIIPILFCLSSVLATDINNCQYINTTGLYRLSSNITTNTTWCNTHVACLNLNSDDITLNLNGYSLNNDGGCYYGIDVLQKNNSEPTDVFTNIDIYSGNILDFSNSGIRFNGINLSSVHDLKIINYGSGNGIYLNQPFNSLEIYKNYIETGNYAITGSGYYTTHIYNNDIKSFNGLYLNGFGFNVERNLFGNMTLISKTNNGNFFTNNWFYSNISTECSINTYQLDNAITCDFCSNSTISNNIIVSQNGINVINDAHTNRISQNQYYQTTSFSTIANFDSSTYDNTFCSNTITSFAFGGFDATNLICYWTGTTENAKSYVIDSDSNTILENCVTNCIPMYMCNSTNKVHLNSTCGIDTIYSCEYGCINGVCSGTQTLVFPYTTTTTSIPMTQQYNISMNTPVINQTDLQEASVTWMTPFFTPLFLIIIMEIVISSIIAWISKQPVTFPITIFILSAVFGVMGLFGTYGIWIASIICIVSAVIGGFMFKNVVQG